MGPLAIITKMPPKQIHVHVSIITASFYISLNICFYLFLRCMCVRGCRHVWFVCVHVCVCLCAFFG